MDKFSIIQQNVITAVHNSELSFSEKQDIYYYLFWNQCWDFILADYLN